MYGLTDVLDALWSAGWSCVTLAKIPERAGICGNDQDRQKKNAGNWGTKLHLGEIGGSKTGPTCVWRPISLYGNGTGKDEIVAVFVLTGEIEARNGSRMRFPWGTLAL